MGTQRTFAAMLNEHLNYDLLKEELVKRDYILQTVEKDDGWKGGNLPVPFKGAQASSVAFGGLTAQTDVAEDVLVRGVISSQPEIWGTMIFNQRDIMEHNGKVKEDSFLKILADNSEDMVDYLRQVLSLSFLNGAAFATLTANASANDGNITVDRPERFVIGQKVVLKSTANTVTAYVKTIDMDGAVINVVTARGGSTVVDFSQAGNTMTTAAAAKVYFDGSQTAGNQLSSLKAMLLSAANGGSATLYGQTKMAYPYLQAIQYAATTSGAVTAANVLNVMFAAYVKIRNRGKGNPDTVLVSYKHFGSIMAILESQKGAYHIEQNSTKVNAYGWTEVVIFGVKGKLKVVALQEMDDDWMPFIDWRALKLHSNGFIKPRKNPDTGAQYFEIRNQTGYQYLVDICFFGDLVLNRPSTCGVMYGITNY